jgi:predicted restriction endonuclease
MPHGRCENEVFRFRAVSRCPGSGCISGLRSRAISYREDDVKWRVARIGIPSGITREDVQCAVETIRKNGIPETFSTATDYVLVIDGEWFPPKAVIALAAERVAGRVLVSSDFSGGDGPGQANRVLRRLGFEVVRRHVEGLAVDPIARWAALVSSTRRATIDGTKSAHQPATITFYLGRFLAGEPQMVRWSSVRRDLNLLLQKCGGGRTAQYPLRVLTRAGVLEGVGIENLDVLDEWTRGQLDQVDPAFGLPTDLYNELGASPDRITELKAILVNLFESPTQAQVAFEYCGLADPNYGFGQVPGIQAGALFASREEVRRAGLHKHGMRGISTTEGVGAHAIVISGGYPDDEDHGDWFIYTGDGGRDAGTKQQVADQTLTIGNQGLIWSYEKQLPVRVIRGSGGDPKHSPPAGYRYDGLYRVTKYWTARADDGFLRYHFQFEREGVEDARLLVEPEPIATQMPSGREQPERRPRTSSQIVRDSRVKEWVKSLYNSECQVCGHVIETRNGRLAEAAHIVPLGDPHGGPDIVENLLCLCPNHHRAFDVGVWSISDDWQVVETSTERSLGPLTVGPGHGLRLEYIRKHRSIHEI